jgi:hypothetical protein
MSAPRPITRRFSFEPAMMTSFISAPSMRSSCREEPAQDVSFMMLSMRSTPRSADAEKELSLTFERTRCRRRILLKTTRLPWNS